MAAAIATALEGEGLDCVTYTEGEEALRKLGEAAPDVLVTDRRMPGMDGLSLMREALRRNPRLPVILVTAFADVPSAVTALKEGAFDYLAKPFDNDELRATVRRALERTRLLRENELLRAELRSRHDAEIVGESEAMRAALELTDRAAVSTATVLIEGESGTGKELVARRLHYRSERAAGPFVAVNCKAFADSVLESELFGHEKSAFTGAQSAHAGCFERADGGTLFLDEIGETSVAFQAKLLRVLQESEVLRVGGSEPRKVDVRIFAATNRDLRAEIAEDRFREDLYFRLGVIPIRLPPLRERREDVPALARHFLASHRSSERPALRLTPEAEERLTRHDWPGNVRELANAIERAVVLTPGDELDADAILLEQRAATAPADDATLQEHLDDAARERIRRAVDRHGSRRSDAARELGIDRTTLFRWMKRLGLQ